MVSGFVAVFLRKGSRRHALAGKVFVVSMLSLALSGVYMAVVKSQPGNVLGGALTFYLVATAWITAKRNAPVTGGFDWCALLIAIAVGATNVTLPGSKTYAPPRPDFLSASSFAKRDCRCAKRLFF